MKLIVSKTCPFAQRAWIAAKALEFSGDIEVINLAKKPDWFLTLTDFAKVPVLICDDQRVVWESVVICHYLNELYGHQLSPSDRLTNAINEAWMQPIGAVQSSAYKMASAENTPARNIAVQVYQDKLQLLERCIKRAPFFNGEQFCLIDIFYAVVFLRADFIAQHYQLDLYHSLPKIAKWAENLLQHPAVQAATAPDFFDMFSKKYFHKG